MDVLEHIKGENYYLIDFYASWCGPCKIQSQILDAIESKLPDNFEVIRIDVDKEKAITMQFNVMYQVKGIPTLFLFHKDKLLWKHYGVKFENDLFEILQNYFENQE